MRATDGELTLKDVEIIIGELKEFKRSTLEELKIIRAEVRDIIIFKWKVTGIMAFTVGVFELTHLISK